MEFGFHNKVPHTFYSHSTLPIQECPSRSVNPTHTSVWSQNGDIIIKLLLLLANIPSGLIDQTPSWSSKGRHISGWKHPGNRNKLANSNSITIFIGNLLLRLGRLFRQIPYNEKNKNCLPTLPLKSHASDRSLFNILRASDWNVQ